MIGITTQRMRRLSAIILIVFIAWLTLIYFRRRAVQLIDWDIYQDGAETLLFTIEDDNQTIYVETLDTHLRTGQQIKIYALSADRQLQDDGSVAAYIATHRPIYTNDMAVAHPWLITVGQMDRDDDVEVFVGAYYQTRYYAAQVRPYFLAYRQGVLVREWTGSRLADQAFQGADFITSKKDGLALLKVDGVSIINQQRQYTTRYYRHKNFTPYYIEDNEEERSVK